MTLNQLKAGSIGDHQSRRGRGRSALPSAGHGAYAPHKVTLQKTAPMGDPIEIQIQGLRADAAGGGRRAIEVEQGGGAA
jgi:hypothetical protein